MATQTVTIQVDPATAEVVRALAATAERIGKSTADLLAHLKATGEPLTLNVNSGEKVVLQEASSYQKLLEDLDFAESMAAVQRGMEDAKAGRVKTLEEFEAEMRTEFGFPEARPGTQ
jgi:predicted transcriptional regulator